MSLRSHRSRQTYSSVQLATEQSSPVVGARTFPWVRGGWPRYRDSFQSLLSETHLVSLSIFVFAVCIAPTLISSESYLFRWDDSEYLWRSIVASKAFWGRNRHELGLAMRSIRPPIMTLLGVPWGPLSSWDAAGKCFVTLSVITAALVALCVFLLLRVGIKPLYLMIASVCVFASLGPFPQGADAHSDATGLLADSFFAWNAFAALLLIPYEVAVPVVSKKGALMRGLLWGAIFSLGAMTKTSFLYFIVLVIPVLVFLRWRNSGRRSALFSLGVLAICSLPVAIYWLRWGLPALRNAWAASFGHDAPFYYIPFWHFVAETIRQSPGMLLPILFLFGCIVYWASKRPTLKWSMNLVPLCIIIGYCAITLSSSNRDLRYSFLGIIALPFVVAMLMSDGTRALPWLTAAVAGLAVFGYLAGVGFSTLHRADRRSIARGELVVTQAASSNARTILLATDSRTLNWDQLLVAAELSSTRHVVEVQSLADSAPNGTSIDQDFEEIRKSDLVVFQDTAALWPAFANQRVSEYEAYTKRVFGEPIKIGDVKIYGRPAR